MEKSPEAFRTISEVAQSMDLPQHVLRFWETRFPQIRPLKRAGGRRYYRPNDVERLRLIRSLLYEEGYTIKGVQKLFREQGVQKLTSGASEPELGFAALEAEDASPIHEPPTAAADAEPAYESADRTMIGYGGGASPDDLAALKHALAELVEAARVLDRARSRDGS